MAKKTTVTKGFYQNISQVDNFLKKEFGSDKEYLKKKEELMSLSKKIGERQADFLAETVLKDKNRKAYKRTFEWYGGWLAKYFKGYDTNKIRTVDRVSLGKIIAVNDYTQRNNPFVNEGDKYTWTNDPGAKAIGKFTSILLKNDMRKLEYYRDCLTKTDQPLDLKTVLDTPTPVIKKATGIDMDNLAKKTKELLGRLNEADSFLHVNSAEFKKMKTALKSLNEGLSDVMDPNELGSRLEALQEASMEYVQAKGVGMQSTEFGIDRMSAALDICEMSSDYMDFYASKKRCAQVKAFEYDKFNQRISKDITNEYLPPEPEISKPDDGIEVIYTEEPSLEIDAFQI